MKRKIEKKQIYGAFIAAALLFISFLYRDYLDFAVIKVHQKEITAAAQAMPIRAALCYMGLYIAVTALSLPGATVLGMLSGAIFGFTKGLLLTSFASSIGATLAFLVVRFLLRDSVQRRLGQRLAIVNRGIEQEGAFYLFGLRLVPLFPFFLINILLALTPIKTTVFYTVSQIAMLPGTAVYVNAGMRLAELESAEGLLAPQLLLSFALLGLFPLLAKKSLQRMRNRKK